MRAHFRFLVRVQPSAVWNRLKQNGLGAAKQEASIALWNGPLRMDSPDEAKNNKM